MAHSLHLVGAERLRGAGAPLEQRRHILRIVGFLYMLGGAVGGLSLFLDSIGSRAGLLAVSGAAFLVGAPLALFSKRVPLWGAHVVTVLGTALIGLAVYFSGDVDSVDTLMFVWPALFSAYIFPPRQMTAHIGWVLVVYGAVLVTLHHPQKDFSPPTLWLLTAPAIAATGLLMSRLLTRQRAAERANRNLAAIIESSQDSVIGVSLDGTITSWNEGAEHLYGYAADEAVGRPWSMLALPERADEMTAVLARVAAGERLEPYETVRRRSDGREIYESVAVSPVCDDAGEVVGASAVARDITARRQLEDDRAQLLAQIRAMARTDPLTKLPNRRAWDDELDRELVRAERRETPLAVALLDIDRFKRFNDEHGHLVGDDLLRGVAANWRATLRSADFMARYGGEEFAVLLCDCSPEEARETLERLRDAIPMGQTCSVGLATWDGEESGTMLTGRADAALYEAKRAGRDRVVTAAAPEPQAAASA